MAAAAFGTGTLLLFAFIYWQSAVWESSRIDTYLRHESEAIAREPSGTIASDVTTRFARDLHRQSFVAIFDGAHALLNGELARYPAELPTDALAHDVIAIRTGPAGGERERVRAMARKLPDGRILVVGRTEQDVEKLHYIVLRALALGLLPALALALGIGIFASRRTLNRVRGVNRSVARIMQGNLQERLEHRGTTDTLDQLAGSVNRMLDEIQHLVEEVQGVGDDIAHDLRTPLTRVRAKLERGVTEAGSRQALEAIVCNAITDLDQALATITSLLRIGQFEAGARREGFADVDLEAIAREAADFYRPLAELRGITLDAPSGRSSPVAIWGDRGLLFEAAANLLDNALKFTPQGGIVSIRLRADPDGAVLSVADNGPGIPEPERALALKRFHRGDRSRHVPGNGLGLNLVAAIVRLHGFQLRLADASPGLRVDICCWAAA